MYIAQMCFYNFLLSTLHSERIIQKKNKTIIYNDNNNKIYLKKLNEDSIHNSWEIITHAHLHGVSVSTYNFSLGESCTPFKIEIHCV